MRDATVRRWTAFFWLSRLGLLLPRRLIPTRFAYAVAERIADLLYPFVGKRSLVTNLTRVLGNRDAAEEAARQVFRNFGRYVIDLYQVPVLDKAAIRERTRFDEWSSLDAVVARGKGTIFVTLHLGHWEMGGAALAAHGYKVTAIAETLEYGPMNGLIQGFRSQLGMNIIAADKARPGVFRALARNEVLGMLIDVVEPGEGVTVDFFGAPAEMSSAPARIALRTGARIVPGVVSRSAEDPTQFCPAIDFDVAFTPSGEEEADVVNLTQALARSFETMVRRFPEQWFAFRPVWTAPPEEPGPSLFDRLCYYSLWAASRIGARLPRGVAYALARFGGDIAYRKRAAVRENVRDNLRHVVGPSASTAAVERHVRNVFRGVGLYYADLIREGHIPPSKLMASEFRFFGLEEAKAAAKGRGVVAVTAHFGNPEATGPVTGLLGLDVLVLTEPLQPPAMSRLVHELRDTGGARFAEVSLPTLRLSLRHLKKGGWLAVTSDRDIQGSGIPLPFFGEETNMPIGAAELALRGDALLVPVSSQRRPGGYDVIFSEPTEPIRTGNREADIIANTKMIVGWLEKQIGADPGQWLALERIWEPPSRQHPRTGRAPVGATMAPTPEASQEAGER